MVYHCYCKIRIEYVKLNIDMCSWFLTLMNDLYKVESSDSDRTYAVAQAAKIRPDLAALIIAEPC